MTIKLTREQASMVSTYATESVHECTSMELHGNTLHINDREAAIEDLYEAGNSADEDKRGSSALFIRVARKIREAA